MDYSFKHIGLQVTREDLSAFYVAILDLKFLYNFKIPAQEAERIFGIFEEVEVIYATSGEIDFELFVSNSDRRSFNHICIETKGNDLINKITSQSKYKVCIREKVDKPNTYFLTDANNNVFEIKPIS
ncbi:MAG: hypothetical protein JXR54_06845 [Tannerellaceae bacterium]|nr:hypothetical protein [Tannerellaceae bacterium]